VLRATSHICSVGPEARPALTAALVPEPENPHDSNAIANYSPKGKIRHLSRDDALTYIGVLVEALGADGASRAVDRVAPSSLSDFAHL
jgi:plasmid stability protein